MLVLQIKRNFPQARPRPGLGRFPDIQSEGSNRLALTPRALNSQTTSRLTLTVRPAYRRAAEHDHERSLRGDPHRPVYSQAVSLADPQGFNPENPSLNPSQNGQKTHL